MAAGDDIAASFVRLGASDAPLPVVLSVPHAGRHYPPALLRGAAVERDRLEALEDRHADHLIEGAIAAGATAFVAQNARAWIDLNRDEREIDPGMLVDRATPTLPVISSAKTRGGLGLIPRRLAGIGELMRGRLEPSDVATRIARHHRPWHQAIADTLSTARARHGFAVLLDIHSMPSLPHAGGSPTRIVFGDRHGRSAGRPLIDRLAAVADTARIGWRINDPYAGGYTLNRHGRPAEAIHAIQIEFDRTLYLAPDLRAVAPGAAAVSALLAAMVMEVAQAAFPSALAAE